MKIYINMHLKSKYAKYANINRTHFIGNIMKWKTMLSELSYLLNWRTCICIFFTALVTTLPFEKRKNSFQFSIKYKSSSYAAPIIIQEMRHFSSMWREHFTKEIKRAVLTMYIHHLFPLQMDKGWWHLPYWNDLPEVWSALRDLQNCGCKSLPPCG